LLYFVSDRDQLIQFNLTDLNTALETGKYYKGKRMGNSVVDFAVMNTGKVCSISENGIMEDAMVKERMYGLHRMSA
jgi:hypothetical protein